MTNDEDLATITVGEHRSAVDVADADWPPDDVCVAAVEVARAAVLEEVDADQIGQPLGLVAEGPLVVTHYFQARVPGYVGWRWAVTLTRAPDSDVVTVDETALLPDETALLAPAWVPWKNRIESGDLGAGDVMVTEPDDQRLMPGMTDNDVVDSEADDEVLPRLWELGLGRERILSPQGRSEAAHRWYREVGPRSQIARAADLHCATCGFLLLIGGPLGQAFGVCANGFSPVDGRIVALDFGCGAHSEMVQQPLVPVAEMLIDEVGYDHAGAAEHSEQAERIDAEDVSPAGETGVADPSEPESASASAVDEEQPDSAPQAERETMQEKQSEEGS